MEKSNSPKLAFFYCLALVTLIIGSVSFGTILFELINRWFPLINDSYNYYGDGSGLKAAISGMFIAFPIFYFITRNIYMGIEKKEFDIDSGARKWLTYFIIFISSVVMIGSLIGLLNSFLDGETTANFIFKALAVLGTALAIFGFYFNDIKQKEVNEGFNKIYFFISAIIVIIVFISAFFIVESPIDARNRRIDQKIINNLDVVKGGIDQYYSDYKVLPQSLNEVKAQEYSYINMEEFIEQSTGKYYDYRIVDEKKFELCASFSSSNLDNSEGDYYATSWKHDKGYQCITKRVEDYGK